MKEKAVLFIDDEVNELKPIKRQLQLYGFKIFIAKNAVEAFSILEKEEIPIVISSQRMPDITGVKLLAKIKARFPKTVRIIISDASDLSALEDDLNKGEIFKFIPKPWDEDFLVKSIDQAFEYYQELENNERKKRVLDNALEAVVITNINNTIESCNLSFLMLTGYSNEEVTNKNIWDYLKDESEEDQQNILDEVSNFHIWQGESILTTKTNNKIYGLLSVSEINHKQRNNTYHTFSFFNIPELREKENALDKSIKHDFETGLLNRLGFEEELTTLLFSHSKSHSHYLMMVLYFQNFTNLSNILGTEFSIHSSLQISNILVNDINNTPLLGRLNQNIFAFLTTENQSPKDWIDYIIFIKNQFCIPFSFEHHEFELVPSIGISVFPNNTKIPRQLIDQALLSAQYAFEMNCDAIFYSHDVAEQMKKHCHQILGSCHRRRSSNASSSKGG